MTISDIADAVSIVAFASFMIYCIARDVDPFTAFEVGVRWLGGAFQDIAHGVNGAVDRWRP